MSQNKFTKKTPTQKRRARKLYIEGWDMKKIAEDLDVNLNTLTNWKKKYKWNRTFEKTEEELSEEETSQLIKEQMSISQKTQKEILYRLNEQSKVRETIKNIRNSFNKLVKEEKVTKKDVMTFTKAMNTAQSQLMGEQTLFKLMAHGLEIVRPKTNAQYNFMKQDNNNVVIKVNIPKGVREKLDEIQLSQRGEE